MNNNIVVVLTPRRAQLVHNALVEYVKHVCKDDCCTEEYEIREMDRLIGYSGELEG